jgi:hypothetical protein
MWTIALLLIVIVLPLVWLLVSIRQQNAAVSRSWSVTQAEVGLERLTRDLRQAVAGTPSFTWSGSTAQVNLTVPKAGTQGATTQAVVWSCTFGNSGTCTRTVGSGSAVAEIQNVEGISFAPEDAGGNQLASGSSTQAVFVGITLTVQDTSALDHNQAIAVRTGARNIVVTDGVDLRNNSL